MAALRPLQLIALLILLLVSTTRGAADAPASDAADAGWKVAPASDNSFHMELFAGHKLSLHSNLVGWGPNWSPCFTPTSQDLAKADVLHISSPLAVGNPQPTLTSDVQSTGPRQITYAYSLSSQNDVPILQLVATIGADSIGAGGPVKAVINAVDGSQQTLDLPLPHPGLFGVAKSITLTGANWEGPVTVTLDPAMPIGGDGDLRIGLAADAIKTGATTAKLTWNFPQDCTAILSKEALEKYAPLIPTSDWFAYKPAWDIGSSAIGMEDWLDKPAGKHGGVRMHGSQFAFEDGTPVKFWGVCLSYMASAPSKEDAEFTAARFAKYGVNAVRMHKFTGPNWSGIGSSNSSTQSDPQKLDALDYFAYQLEQHGVYFGWSHTYHFTVRPVDKKRVSGYDELMKNGGDTYAVINWAEDVQDLMIERVVNLLKHQNPYTGKTYAQDPGLCYVELQNEDDIFFFTSAPALDNYPTYRKQLETHFAQWLTTKYSTQDALAAAWNEALLPGETLDAANLKIEINPWLFSDQHLPATNGGDRQRLLDTAEFLHVTQDKFYTRFVKAIRDAGYQGPLVGSPWQAPAQLPSFYNLKSDSDVGYVDRHDYFGGGVEDSMLAHPGGGYLSAGLQQVADRPFGLSEWIHVYPSLYSAEGPALLAIYGMGLQGWNASYEFQSTTDHPDSSTATVAGKPNGIWNADAPTQLGQYPILARMIMRGDVTTAPVISSRNISPHDLEFGSFNFSDQVKLNGDVKTFSGSTPAASLAAGRDVIAFVDHYMPSTFPDMTKYTSGSVITSATGQLKWDTSNRGVVTINTPGTQGFVGFGQGRHMAFDDVSIDSQSPYASLLITAANVKASLANDSRVLISAVARNANSGFRASLLDGVSIIDPGRAPIMLEPVKANIHFAKRKITQVNILDHDGRQTGKTIPVADGAFSIDTGRDQAIYYEVILSQ